MARMKWHRVPRGYNSVTTGSHRPPKKIADGYRYHYADLDTPEPLMGRQQRGDVCGTPAAAPEPSPLEVARQNLELARLELRDMQVRVLRGAAGASGVTKAQWAEKHAREVVLRLEGRKFK